MDVKSKLFGLAAMGTALASGAFAEDGQVPTTWTDSIKASSFGDILTKIAPIAISVAIGVAGVRVAIKLINRGAGK